MRNSGQATIEFLLTFFIALGLLIMFIQLGVNRTSGFLAHYATYMSSRVFLVNDQVNGASDGETQAIKDAKKVFAYFKLDDFGINNFDPDELQFNTPSEVLTSSVKYEYVGARYEFKQAVSFMKLWGSSGEREVKYISESYIGREPTRKECLRSICRVMKLITKKGGSSLNCDGNSEVPFLTLFDNGC